ncbi:hypothetical protein KO561_17655 [Radiobacillus kanasensis]|uniref:hypothetical protein n=1 Tax=Radiobacillus kanasensis TaxID=2844358 RepID=UPI001E4AFCAD|nr:hypothetical protein [Radiobacillus kanasensis]UFT98990.1 hypothetical protein KO561_17655 [Radiobacillus kanasensis]
MKINIKTRIIRIILMITIYTVWLVTTNEPLWETRPGIFYFTTIMAIVYVIFQSLLIVRATKQNQES